MNAAKNILDEGMKILDTVGTTGSACGVDSSVVEIQSRSTVKQESPLLKQSDSVHRYMELKRTVAQRQRQWS